MSGSVMCNFLFESVDQTSSSLIHYNTIYIKQFSKNLDKWFHFFKYLFLLFLASACGRLIEHNINDCVLRLADNCVSNVKTINELK